MSAFPTSNNEQMSINPINDFEQIPPVMPKNDVEQIPAIHNIDITVFPSGPPVVTSPPPLFVHREDHPSKLKKIRIPTKYQPNPNDGLSPLRYTQKGLLRSFSDEDFRRSRPSYNGDNKCHEEIYRDIHRSRFKHPFIY